MRPLHFGLLPALAALSSMSSDELDRSMGADLIVGPASDSPIHHRGRFKPNARKDALRHAKRAGKRRQQGRR